MEKEVLIRAPNVCKTYSTGSEQCHAIKNMNIDIYAWHLLIRGSFYRFLEEPYFTKYFLPIARQYYFFEVRQWLRLPQLF